MSFLDKFFDRDRPAAASSDESVEARDEKLPAVLLAMRDLPTLHLSEEIIDRINDLPHIGGDARLTTELGFDTGEAMLAVIEFGPHRVRVLGLDSPLPEQVIERTVPQAVWGDDEKSAVLSHEAHIILWYTGSETDPVEQYLALYRVAHGFAEHGLLGVVNEAAWTFTPAGIVADLVEPAMVEECREQVPPHFWIGFVRSHEDEGVWYGTKGQYFFGVPDFAYFDQQEESGSDIFDIFYNLFLYCYDGMKIAVGDTCQLGENYYLRFEALPAEQEWLAGPAGTLVLQKIRADEINQ